MNHPAITFTNRDVLRAISTYWNLHGYAPSITDLAEALSVSRTAVFRRVETLRARGEVSAGRTNRTLRLTPAGIKALEGTFPMEPFDVATLRRKYEVAHLIPSHVECSGVLQAVVES